MLIEYVAIHPVLTTRISKAMAGAAEMAPAIIANQPDLPTLTPEEIRNGWRPRELAAYRLSAIELASSLGV